jgi:hypothetical protein
MVQVKQILRAASPVPSFFTQQEYHEEGTQSSEPKETMVGQLDKPKDLSYFNKR